MADRCTHCGAELEPVAAGSDPPHDNGADGLIGCADCKTTGDDPVVPGTPCMRCEGAGWL